MLLMGRWDASLTQVSYDSNPLAKRRHSEMVADHFWSQFIRHYLPTLQVCQKWKKPTKNLAKDTVVLTHNCRALIGQSGGWSC